MADNLFDKIKAHSKEYSEQQVPADALLEFRKYQAKRDAPKKNLWNYLLLGMLTFLLVGSNIYWFFNQTTNSNHITNTHLTTSKTDTIYITKYLNEKEQTYDQGNSKVISKYEYESLIMGKNRLNSIESSISHLKNKLAFLVDENSSLKEKHKNDIPFNLVHIESTTGSYSNSLLKENVSLIEKNNVIGKLPITTSPLTFDQRHFHLYDRISKRDIDSKSQFSYLIPKTLSLFVSSGLNLEKGDGLNLLKGPHFEIGLSTLFSYHFRSKLSLRLAKATGELEDSFIVPDFIPKVMPPEGAVLNELYLTSDNKTLSIGFDYLFKPTKVIRPFVGISYSIGHQKYINIDYKYNLGVEQTKLSANNSSSIISHFTGFTLGSDINLSNNFDAFINGTCAYGISGNINTIVQFNTGLQYHF